jgi:predicted permease
VGVLVLLLVCMALGAAARRSGQLPADSHRVVNAWVLNVSLPAVVLRSVHAVPLSTRLVVPVLGLWLGFALAALVAVVAVKRGASRGVAGALALCAGLANTSFVGLPLLEALGGAEALGPAVVVDQLGSFLALGLGAVPLAAWLSGGKVSVGFVLRRALLFPPFIALVLALLLRPVALPGVVDTVLARLGDMLSPLALASVGWQLDASALKGQGGRVALGLSYKLVLAPLVMLGLVWATAPNLGVAERVAVAQAAMAPMVTGGVLASEYELEPKLAAGLVALGVPLSLVTVPAWWWLLGRLSGA